MGNRSVIIIEARDIATQTLTRIEHQMVRMGGVLVGTKGEIGKLNTKVNELEPDLDKQPALWGRFKSAIAGAAANLVAFAASYASIKGLRMVHDLALMGAQADMTEASFERMLASVGVAPGVLDDMKRAAGGTIPEMKLMQALNTSLIGVSSEFGQAIAVAYPKLVEMARAANMANPALGDVAYMLQSLSIGLKRNSPLIIDNLGIQVKLTEANERAAEMYGKLTKELTVEEKQMGLLNLTMERGQRLIDQVGLSNASAVVKQQALGAAWADTSVEVGRSLDWLLGYQGIVTRLVGTIGRMAEQHNMAARTGRLFAEAIREGQEAGELSWMGARQLERGLGVLQNQMKMGLISEEKFTSRLLELAKATDIAAMETVILDLARREQEKTTARAIATEQQLMSTYVQGSSEVRTHAENIEDLNSELRTLRDSMGDLSAVMDPAYSLDLQGFGKVPTHAENIEDLNYELRTLRDSMGDLSSVMDPLYSLDEIIPEAERLRRAGREGMEAYAEGWTGWTGDPAYDLSQQMTPDETTITDRYKHMLATMNEEIAAEQAKIAEKTRLKWEAEYEKMRNAILGIMSPTMGDEWKEVLPREDAWDEWARRAGAIVAEGQGSEWIDKLAAFDPDFQKLLEEMGDPKSAAATWIEQFYAGMHPEAVNIDKVAEEYIAMIEASERWNAIADAVAAKVSAAGYGVSREAIQALAMGDKMKAVELLEEEEAMKATVEAYGETAATALSEPFKEGLTTPTYVQDMLDALNAQFDEQEAEWDALGLKMGGAVSAGFLKAMMSPTFMANLVQKLAPEILRYIGETGWGRCGTQRAQAGGVQEV